MRGQRALSVLYYGGLALLVVLIAVGALGEVLPGSVAGAIGRNSEAYVMAFVLTAWIELIRSRRGQTLTWPVTAFLGLVLLGASVALLQVDLSAVHTLNESAFALCVLVFYVRIPRPLPAWGWALPIVALALPIVFAGTTFGTDGAEAFGFLLLIPLTLDLVDRSILEPAEPRRLSRVGLWIVVMMAVPIIVAAVRPDSPVGVVEQVLRYLSRPTEAFISVILLLGYFWLRSRGRPRTVR